MLNLAKFNLNYSTANYPNSLFALNGSEYSTKRGKQLETDRTSTENYVNIDFFKTSKDFIISYDGMILCEIFLPKVNLPPSSEYAIF